MVDAELKYRPPSDLKLKHQAPRRYEVLSFIRSEIASGRPCPSTKQIAAHMGWKNSQDSVLVSLFVDGYLTRTASRPRMVQPRYVYALASEA